MMKSSRDYLSAAFVSGGFSWRHWIAPGVSLSRSHSDLIRERILLWRCAGGDHHGLLLMPAPRSARAVPKVPAGILHVGSAKHPGQTQSRNSNAPLSNTSHPSSDPVMVMPMIPCFFASARIPPRDSSSNSLISTVLSLV